MNSDTNLPKITVWLAARNEEKNIIDCLVSLEKQDYPNEKIQILIGNDNSTDSTEKIVADFIKGKAQFQLVNVNTTINNQRGKANVLANLYEKSTGSYFLITDADVVVPKTWSKTMVQKFINNPQLGHLIGTTTIKSAGIWTYLQALDWLWALTLLKIASVFKIPLTGLGNNSAISRKAYEATGGYAAIPFSITEDFALFHAIIAQKFEFHNILQREVFAKTNGMETLKEFLHQRKRWMVGAMQCPWWVILFLYLQAFFPIILLVLSVLVGPYFAFKVFILKFISQFLLIFPTLILLKEYRLIFWLIPYEFYSWLWGLTMVFFYFLPIEINWKGRYY